MKMDAKFKNLFQKWNTMSDTDFEHLLLECGVEKITLPPKVVSNPQITDTTTKNDILYKYIKQPN